MDDKKNLFLKLTEENNVVCLKCRELPDGYWWNLFFLNGDRFYKAHGVGNELELPMDNSYNSVMFDDE